MANRIILNETSYHGVGSCSEIATEVKRRGFKKAFFVTDKALIKFGVASGIEKVLKESATPYEVFSELKANPTVKNVQDGVDAFKKLGADFILTLGSGSAIGAVKQLSLSVGIPQKLHEIGVKEEDMPELAVAAFNDVCTGGNPRTTPVINIEELYRKAF